nr:histamine releasing peptide [Vespa orientalis]prf//1501209A peptide HR1 [Vespa orientalis]
INLKAIAALVKKVL